MTIDCGETEPAPVGAGSRQRTAMAALWAVIAFLLAVVGCGGGATPPAAGPAASTEVPAAESETGSDEESAQPLAAGRFQLPASVPSSAEVPVDGRDPSWGNPAAPVTVVAFMDLQCPFCQRAHQTLKRLQQDYGPETLRVVYKHHPLPFHHDALPAAMAAQAVYEAAGSEAFFAYVSLLFENQRSLSDANLVQYAEDVGVDRATLLSRTSSPDVRDRVQSGMDLAQKVGALGTPNFRINGVTLTGAQPYEKFAEVIDAERAKARALTARGVPPERVYAERVAENYRAPEPRAPTPAPKPPDRTVWKIPVGKSPTKGPATALVTIVEFADYECPFCSRVQSTLDAIFQRYPGQVRLVYKHNPLPFHKQALPAAIFASEARAQRGDKGFWQAHELLFENQKELRDEDLLEYAGQLKLNVARVKTALTKERHKKAIESDQQLAQDFEARGTPSFFINGRKLAGAQPLEKFVELIDEELGKAKDLVAKKKIPAARVYAEIMKTAKAPPPPEKKSVGAPSKANPSRGPVHAPIVVQLFSDFQCPFCKRLAPTLKQLEQAYPGRVRIVWRNLPLPFHQNARLAAVAAMEAHAQGGNKKFWEMHDLLFAGQGTPGGLERPALEGHAAQLGLDLQRFRKALDDGRHDKVILADESEARSAGLSGTPSTVINGYYVSGAQPLNAFKTAVRHALNDLKQGRRP